MLSFLKDHPFAVEAFFKSSVVLTFAIPKEHLQNLIPECLQLDTFKDKWAFVAVAMVQTKGLRPKGFPKFMGSNFFLIGYRVFVRYLNKENKNLRGLYILKSETNAKRMEVLGNIFTQYNYTTTDIIQTEQANTREIKSIKSNFKVRIDDSDEEILLPINSPFENWKEARRFAGPLPFTFSYNSETSEVIIIEGVRQNWTPIPLKIIEYNFSFFRSLYLENPILANAFIIENVPYYWKKGKKEIWKK